MAFASALRRIASGSSTASSIFQSQYASIRLNSTLTTPKLFVSGLSRTTDDEKLANTFSQFGRLLESRVITERSTGRSRGFAFVTYETVEDAEKARQGMHGQFLDGWVIFVDPAKPREFRPPPQAQPQSQPPEAGFRTNKTIGWCG